MGVDEIDEKLQHLISWDQSKFSPLSFHQLMYEVIDQEQEPDLNLHSLIASFNYFLDKFGIVPYELDTKPEEDAQKRSFLSI